MKKNKKIIFLSPAHPLRGGIASSTERLAEEMQRTGYDVLIYSFSLQYPSLFFPGKTQYTDDPPQYNLNILSKVNSINPLNWLKIGKEIRNHKPDIIITRYWLPFLAPCLGSILRIAKTPKTKIIAITDNVLPHENRFGDKMFTKYFLKSADAFIVMSRSVENEIRLFDKQKPVKYIPHPLYDNYGELIPKNEAKKVLNLDENTSYILFFGFIRKYKGLDLLLHAMADEKIKNSNIKLIIAGEYYSNREFYENLISQLNLSDKLVIKTDFIPHEEVKYYFCASDIVVQTYRSATQSGISQLAYHFEKPMIVTNVGGLPEIVIHNKTGYVVNVDKNEIAKAIIAFFDNKKEKEFTEEVKKMKEKFSWSFMVNAIEKM